MYAAGPNAYLLPTNQLCQLQILTMNQLAERYLHVARYRVDLLVALCGHLGKERLERRLYQGVLHCPTVRQVAVAWYRSLEKCLRAALVGAPACRLHSSSRQ
jgi:hypothetical protein